MNLLKVSFFPSDQVLLEAMQCNARLELLFPRRPQAGDIRLNIDVEVAVPFQYPVWREPHPGRYIRSLLAFLPRSRSYVEQE
jgi:hypothetical protein